MDFNTIIKYSFENIDYFSKVRPFITNDSYDGSKEGWEIITSFAELYDSYGMIPTFDSVKNHIYLNRGGELSVYDNVINNIRLTRNMFTCTDEGVVETIKFIKHNIIKRKINDFYRDYSINNVDSKMEKLINGIESAMNIHLDESIGLEYTSSVLQRHEFYNKQAYKIPSGITSINKLTFGGYERKTLNIIMAMTNFGKTMFEISEASHILKNTNLKVLYVSLEIQEMKVAQRFDANLLSLYMLDAKNYKNKETYIKNVNDAIEKYKITRDRLIIKEFPTGSLSIKQLKAYLKKLQQLGKLPDVMFIDYLGIMSTNGKSMYESTNSNAIGLRGLAMEFNICIVSAAQTNRDGYNKEVELGNVSEGYALNSTADLILAGYTLPELMKEGKCVILLLKNRYSDMVNQKIICIQEKKLQSFWDSNQDANYYISDKDKRDEKNVSVYLEKITNPDPILIEKIDNMLDDKMLDDNFPSFTDDNTTLNFIENKFNDM